MNDNQATTTPIPADWQEQIATAFDEAWAYPVAQQFVKNTITKWLNNPVARCGSCEHRIPMHGPNGCEQAIGDGPHDEPCCCPCTVSVNAPAESR